MFELKAKSEEKGEDEFDKRLTVVKDLKVGHFIVEIDGDGAVVPQSCGSCAHVLPPDHQVASAHELRWGQHVAISRQSRRTQDVTTKCDGMWEVLHQMIIMGEASLRIVLTHYLALYHAERNHQGLGNQLMEPAGAVGRQTGQVIRRERLGGLLSDSHREAA